MKKISYILVPVIFFVPLFLGPVLADQGGQDHYDKAMQFIKKGQDDFAYLEFGALVRNYPESRFTPDSLFAMGEYCYTRKIYNEAIEKFSAYVKDYPEADGAVFARAYLLKIIQDMDRAEADEGAIEDLERELFSKPLFLLFSRYKEVSYKSTFQNNFTIRYYMDKIEIYRNDKLFIEILQ